MGLGGGAVLRPGEVGRGGWGVTGTVTFTEFVLNKMLTNIISFFPDTLYGFAITIILNVGYHPASNQSGSHSLHFHLAPGATVSTLSPNSWILVTPLQDSYGFIMTLLLYG